MVRRQAKDAGIATPIGCHTFRATRIKRPGDGVPSENA